MELNEQIKDLQAVAVRRKIRLWKPLMEKYGYDVICEIGVRDSRNFIPMIEHNPKLAVAIDPWRETGIPSQNDGAQSQEMLDVFYEDLKKVTADKPFVKIHRDFSFNVVKEYPDEFFDLIYIDADHTYDAVLKDLIDWYPKVRSGGLFSGDDYNNDRAKAVYVRFGVYDAVQKFVKDMHLEDRLFSFPRGGWGIIKP
jgi:hypothetical protein